MLPWSSFNIDHSQRGVFCDAPKRFNRPASGNHAGELLRHGFISRGFEIDWFGWLGPISKNPRSILVSEQVWTHLKWNFWSWNHGFFVVCLAFWQALMPILPDTLGSKAFFRIQIFCFGDANCSKKWILNRLFGSVDEEYTIDLMKWWFVIGSGELLTSNWFYFLDFLETESIGVWPYMHQMWHIFPLCTPKRETWGLRRIWRFQRDHIKRLCATFQNGNFGIWDAKGHVSKRNSLKSEPLDLCWPVEYGEVFGKIRTIDQKWPEVTRIVQWGKWM